MKSKVEDSQEASTIQSNLTTSAIEDSHQVYKPQEVKISKSDDKAAKIPTPLLENIQKPLLPPV